MCKKPYICFKVLLYPVPYCFCMQVHRRINCVFIWCEPPHPSQAVLLALKLKWLAMESRLFDNKFVQLQVCPLSVSTLHNCKSPWKGLK